MRFNPIALSVVVLGLLAGGAASWGAAPAVQASPAPSASAPPAASPAAQQVLADLQTQALTVSNDQRLAAMEAQAAAIEAQLRASVAARSQDLAGIERGLKPLAQKGRRASRADRAKLEALLSQKSQVEAALQQARGQAAIAGATFNRIAERRRVGFSARVLERSASPLSPDFWSSLADAVGVDMMRLNAVSRDVASVALQAPEPRGSIGVLTGLVAAILLAFPLRVRLGRLGRTKSGEAVHPGFARTAAALWLTAVDTGLPALAAASLHVGAQWGGLLSEKSDQMADAAVIAVAWASAILALGRVLATDPDLHHRLLSLPDEAARRLGFPIAAVALVTGAGFLLTRLNYVIGASVAATIAANCMLSLAYAAVAGLILITVGREREPAPQAGTAAARSPAWPLVSLFLTTAIVITLGAVAAGYTTLASLISSQIFWLSLIAATTYLLLRFVDDLCTLLFGREGWAARSLAMLFGLRRSTISQAGLLVSASVQLVILVGALSLALTPFGQSGDLLLAHFSNVGRPIRVGSAVVSPAAIAAGLATLVIGMGVVHLVQRWINRRYLPLTDWDAGLRNSVSTGVGYLGVAIAIACALAAMGFGFQQIALIASALSVGIGFGLQQIVQNFVSGVILLVERPVKVGDWVSVEGVEGDIRRIRVRATEIRTFDRSTVIVPNSDLITKIVQNKTLGEPRSRIKLELGIGNPADADRARDLIVETARQHQRVLADPEPAVYVDSLAAGGAVNFVVYLYVDNPRDVYRVRSELYFQLLEQFQRQNLAFIGAAGPQNVIVEAGPDLQSLLAAAAESAVRHDGAEPGSRRSAGH
jgi:potassium efflux system protein